MTDYTKLYREMHNEGRVYHGVCLKNHAKTIGKFINLTDSKTLLDYGSGKGIQYSKEQLHYKYFNGIMPTLYDIGIEEYSQFPEEKFDGIFSTDVLEHIPEEQLDSVLKQIYNHVNKFVYLAICTIPAPDLLPDGSQSHVTLKPLRWWVNKIKPYATVQTIVHCYGKDKATTLIKVTDGHAD